jgi:Predicted alternative tryptophan synthase beta-subunit (paralog of TrpB)
MTRYILDAEYIPRRWYNIVPDLPEKLAPPLNPATMEPVKPEELEPIFQKLLLPKK